MARWDSARRALLTVASRGRARVRRLDDDLGGRRHHDAPTTTATPPRRRRRRADRSPPPPSPPRSAALVAGRLRLRLRLRLAAYTARHHRLRVDARGPAPPRRAGLPDDARRARRERRPEPRCARRAPPRGEGARHNRRGVRVGPGPRRELRRLRGVAQPPLHRRRDGGVDARGSDAATRRGDGFTLGRRRKRLRVRPSHSHPRRVRGQRRHPRRRRSRRRGGSPGRLREVRGLPVPRQRRERRRRRCIRLQRRRDFFSVFVRAERRERVRRGRRGGPRRRGRSRVRLRRG